MRLIVGDFELNFGAAMIQSSYHCYIGVLYL